MDGWIFSPSSQQQIKSEIWIVNAFLETFSFHFIPAQQQPRDFPKAETLSKIKSTEEFLEIYSNQR